MYPSTQRRPPVLLGSLGRVPGADPQVPSRACERWVKGGDILCTPPWVPGVTPGGVSVFGSAARTVLQPVGSRIPCHTPTCCGPPHCRPYSQPAPLFPQDIYENLDLRQRRASSPGYIDSPTYSRQGMSPTFSRSPHHYYRSGKEGGRPQRDKKRQNRASLRCPSRQGPLQASGRSGDWLGLTESLQMPLAGEWKRNSGKTGGELLGGGSGCSPHP